MSDDPLYQFAKNKAAWQKSAGEFWRGRRKEETSGDEARLKERARAAYLRVGGSLTIFEAGWPQIRARLLRAEAERARRTSSDDGENV